MQKGIFDNISQKCSKIITKAYSTSFSLGIKLLDKRIQEDIYSIYGYVRLGDEIVDSFHGFDKKELIKQFRQESIDAIERGISLNPILNNFQSTVNKYKIEWELINEFIESMELDLEKQDYEISLYEKYIKGSAKNVGLMCLSVFCNNNIELYQKLLPHANALGSAFQKINFLRDIKDDHIMLGRVYFPKIDISKFDDYEKREIEKDIQQDFHSSLEGIQQLPKSSKHGVYLAYIYYLELLKKIKKIRAKDILQHRPRVSNFKKSILLIQSYYHVFISKSI